MTNEEIDNSADSASSHEGVGGSVIIPIVLIIILPIIFCFLIALQFYLGYFNLLSVKQDLGGVLFQISMLIICVIATLLFATAISIKIPAHFLLDFKPFYKKFAFVLLIFSIIIFWAFGAIYYAGHNPKGSIVVLDAINGSDEAVHIYAWCMPQIKGLEEQDILGCNVYSNKNIYNLSNVSIQYTIDDKDVSHIFPYDYSNQLNFMDRTLKENGTGGLNGLIPVFKSGNYGLGFQFNYSRDGNIMEETRLYGEFEVISKQKSEENLVNLMAITLAIFAFPITFLPAAFNSIRDML